MPLLSWYLVQILEPLVGLGHSTIAGHGVDSGVYNCLFYTAIPNMVTMDAQCWQAKKVSA